MKTQKLLRIVRFCLPAVMAAGWWSTTLYAQETAGLLSSVVLEKSPQAESTASPAVSAGENPKPKRFSWKAEPLPKCKSFLIIEPGSGYTLGHSFYFGGDLGLMVNQNEHAA